jgi:hypothetical protein
MYELYGEEHEYSKTQMQHPSPALHGYYTIVHFRFILNETAHFTSRIAI